MAVDDASVSAVSRGWPGGQPWSWQRARSSIAPRARSSIALRAESRIAPPARSRITPRLVWAMAVVVLLATSVVAATLGRDWWQARQLAQANASALAAGRQLAVNFATVDYRRVDQDTGRVRSGATGRFLASYTSSLAQLKKVLVENRSVSAVERAEAGLVSGDPRLGAGHRGHRGADKQHRHSAGGEEDLSDQARPTAGGRQLEGGGP